MADNGSETEQDELIAFIDGEASPKMITRIHANPSRVAAADTYARVQQALLHRLYRYDCPPSQALGDYEMRLLPTAERVRIAQHIATCPHCLAEVQMLRAFLADEPAPAASGILTQARRVVASLLPSSTPLANLRGVATSTTRTYSAGDVMIALDTLDAGHGRLTLTGLLWSEGVADDAEPCIGSLITLHAGEAMVRTTVLDELGNFTFDGIVPGVYTVEVTCGNDRITIEGADISL